MQKKIPMCDLHSVPSRAVRRAGPVTPKNSVHLVSSRLTSSCFSAQIVIPERHEYLHRTLKSVQSTFGCVREILGYGLQFLWAVLQPKSMLVHTENSVRLDSTRLVPILVPSDLGVKTAMQPRMRRPRERPEADHCVAARSVGQSRGIDGREPSSAPTASRAAAGGVDQSRRHLRGAHRSVIRSTSSPPAHIIRTTASTTPYSFSLPVTALPLPPSGATRTPLFSLL
jgi:hypothetical protein